MVEASKASALKSDDAFPVESTGLSPTLELPGADDLAVRSPRLSAAEEARRNDGAASKVPLSQALQSAAANDDFVAINAQLRLLKNQGSRRPEKLALVCTLVIALFFGALFVLFERSSALPWPVLLLVTFVSASTLFFVIATAIRQQTTQTTLTTLLRTAAHLAEPNASERQRMALVPERFRADIAILDRSVARTGDRVNQLVRTMNGDLDAFEKRLKATQEQTSRTLDDLSIERAAIVTNGENLHHVLTTVHTELSKDLKFIAENLQALFESKSSGLIDLIDQRNKDLIRDYLEAEDRATGALKKALDQALVRAVERYEANNDRFLVTMARRQEDYDGRLDRQIRDSIVKADHQIAGLVAKAAEISADASRQVEVLLHRAEAATEQRSKSLQTMLAEAIIQLSQTFKANTLELGSAIEDACVQMQNLEAHCENVKGDLTTQISAFEGAVIQPLDRLTAAFGDRSRVIAEDIVLQITSLNEAASSAASQMGEGCEVETQRIKDIGETSARDIKDLMDRLAQECADAVERCSEAIELSTERLPQAQKTRRKPSQPGVAFVRTGVERPPNVERPPSIERPPIVERPPSVEREETAEPVVVAAIESPLPPQEGQSWITQLLARADAASSTEQEELVPPKSIEAIASVLNRIDNLIVTDEAVAAWDRFREENISSFEKAFTVEGRALLALVKKQIEADDDLYGFVEAYLNKFEVLVKEAYAAADENSLLSYMSSSSGKVYTFLAKAIQRI